MHVHRAAPPRTGHPGVAHATGSFLWGVGARAHRRPATRAQAARRGSPRQSQSTRARKQRTVCVALSPFPLHLSARSRMQSRQATHPTHHPPPRTAWRAAAAQQSAPRRGSKNESAARAQSVPAAARARAAAPPATRQPGQPSHSAGWRAQARPCAPRGAQGHAGAARGIKGWALLSNSERRVHSVEGLALRMCC